MTIMRRRGSLPIRVQSLRLGICRTRLTLTTRAIRDLLLLPVRHRPKDSFRSLRKRTPIEARRWTHQIGRCVLMRTSLQRENSMLTFESSASLGAAAIVEKLAVSSRIAVHGLITHSDIFFDL